MERKDSNYGYFIRAIGLKTKNLLDSKMQNYNLTNPQARLLGVIDRKNKSNVKFSQKDLEKEMILKGSSITSLLQGLEKKGYIIRENDTIDSRNNVITITEIGKELIDDVNDAFLEVERLITLGMSDIEKDMYLKLLNKSLENFKD